MNIIFIGNHFCNERQNQNIWQDLSFHLQKAGYGVLVTSQRKNKVLRLLDMLFTIWQRRTGYEVAQVDVFSGPAFIWAYLSVSLLKKLRKPIILTLHGGNLPEFSLHHPKPMKQLLTQADVVTVPSLYLLEAMRPYRDELILIPNAIDINHYPYIQRVSPRLILIWLRAFHKIYHPELAVEILHLLHKDVPTFRLIMVGPDKGDGSKQKSQLLTTQLGLENFIEFPGSVSKQEVPIWLNKGDIFINTTNYDNTPISVMEAMACGLCVISTNVGGVPYLLDDGVDALLVPQDDPVAMAAAVLRVLTEPGLAGKLSLHARQKVEKLDWSYILPQWTAILNSFR